MSVVVGLPLVHLPPKINTSKLAVQILAHAHGTEHIVISLHTADAANADNTCLFFFQMMHFFTRKKAVLACLLMLAFWCAVYAFFTQYIEVELQENVTGEICALGENPALESSQIHMLLSLSYILIPSCFLIILNISIVIKLKQTQKLKFKLAPYQSKIHKHPNIKSGDVTVTKNHFPETCKNQGRTLGSNLARTTLRRHPGFK